MTSISRIITNIENTPIKALRKLSNDCISHAVRQANGDYYFDEDTQSWTDPKGLARENSIIKILNALCDGNIHQALTHNGDPRGFVVYFEEDMLDEDEKQALHDAGFSRDWGGNYSILKETR